MNLQSVRYYNMLFYYYLSFLDLAEAGKYSDLSLGSYKKKSYRIHYYITFHICRYIDIITKRSFTNILLKRLKKIDKLI